ncbi:hypothetical protein ABTX61_08375 [Amycolatopsis japonica]|uniref:hypothetical protein n=1 Tax=Amycolatopsis japonica TaxID=208439 RepID=UPI003331F6F6
MAEVVTTVEVKKRTAVDSHSVQFSHDAMVSVQTGSMSLAARHVMVSALLWGPHASQTW